MKQSIVAALAAMFLIAGCAKDQFQNEKASQNKAIESRTANLVTLCHKTGSGQYTAIQVSLNAVYGHLAHGDYLLDIDDDGFTAIDACTGSRDDCDDYNSTVYPGAGARE